MSTIGQRKNAVIGALAFAAAAAALVVWMRDFTVDDVWITVRYARSLAEGRGYRFDPAGPSTDGVTPMPYPFVLAALYAPDASTMLARAKWLSAAAWLMGAGWLGWRVARAARAPRDVVFAAFPLALSLPVATYAASGMETGFATLLATIAACIMHRPIGVALVAGAATTLRPELAPWAATLTFGACMMHAKAGMLARAIPRAVLVTALALLPFFVVATIRLVWFGRPAPLALAAKPSDLSHGFVYLVGLLVALTPIVACAPLAIARAGGEAVAIAAAAVVHAVAVVVAGGDWMPYARLFAPITPSLVLVAVLAAPFASRVSRALRFGVASVLGIYLLVVAAPAGRHVGEARAALMRALSRTVEPASTVASVDIGWTSAAGMRVIDLAGLTDPQIAVLPGGHTSKRIDASMLLDRKPDALVFYARLPAGAPLERAEYRHVVEARLAADPILRARFAPRAFLPLHADDGYVVWRRAQ